jgi:hypothetical protein
VELGCLCGLSGLISAAANCQQDPDGEDKVEALWGLICGGAAGVYLGPWVDWRKLYLPALLCFCSTTCHAMCRLAQ